MPADDLELLRRLRSLLECDRGFTLDLRTARPVLTGVAVCVEPSRTLTFRLGAWRDERVLAWIREIEQFVDESGRDDLYLGGWHPVDSDEVHLDVVRVVPAERRSVAEAVGRLHRQLAAFDLSRRAVVELVV